MKENKVRRREFLKTMGMGAAALGVSGVLPFSCKQKIEERPNIVIIFADDLGFSDIGCFGGEIDTPNLDKLAANGKRFTQFYNTSRCCPSRASLLTGLYPHQAGIGMMVYRNYGDGYEGNLNDKCATLGEVLGTAGYKTMMVGKWHAGHEPYSRPEVRGFDNFTGVYPHIDSYWKVLKGCDIYRDKKLYIPEGENPVNPYNPDKEFFTTDFFTDNAMDYIDQGVQDTTQPFLLHLCYNVPHFPLEAPDDLIEKYRGKYKKGWDTLRKEKLERMKKMGLVSEDQKLPVVKSFEGEKREGFDFKPNVVGENLPKWESLNDKDRDELDFRRAMYAAQIDNFDQNIGRLVTHLEKRNILDNTLVMFFSDNGCSGETGRFGMNWGEHNSDNYSEWRKKSGWSISQGECWASYSNTPFRKYKMFVHEGGIASPFIAHWPNGIKNKGEIFNKQIFHISDIMSTVCDAAGISYPENYKGRKIKATAGISMLPFIKEDKRNMQPRTLFWQHQTAAAVREGDWKLVTVDDRDDTKWELYSLSTDRSETNNLIEKHPDIVKKLKAKWKTWAQDSNVMPYPEERGNLKKVKWPPKPWPAG